MVASKFTSDIYYANSRYAKVGGIPLQELNKLELSFLFLIDFDLHISLKDLQEYANQLLNYATTLIPNFETPVLEPTSISSSYSTTTTSSSTLSPPSSGPVLPLTPPYHPKSYKKKYHPYQKPTLQKKKLGLVSPKV